MLKFRNKGFWFEFYTGKRLSLRSKGRGASAPSKPATDLLSIRGLSKMLI